MDTKGETNGDAVARTHMSIDARVVKVLDEYRRTDRFGDKESWTVFFKRLIDTGKLEK